jgi:hypothetical protein
MSQLARLDADQTCELRHNSEHPVRQGERATVNVKQSQGWLSRQTMLSGDKVATRMSDADPCARGLILILLFERVQDF